MIVELTRASWIKAARWLATVLVVPAAWFAGLWTESLLHTRAVMLWCAQEQVSGFCPLPWFRDVDTAALATGALLAAVATVVGTYMVAPSARLIAMWTAMVFAAFAAFLLLVPLAAFPVAAGASIVAVLITWRAWRRQHILIEQSTLPTGWGDGGEDDHKHAPERPMP